MATYIFHPCSRNMTGGPSYMCVVCVCVCVPGQPSEAEKQALNVGT